jgi:hypothetical protein
MLRRYLSLRAIAIGLVVLVGLAVILWGLTTAGLFTGRSSTVALVVAVFLYACGGYIAGATAGHHQVLNAFAVGLLFGLFMWLGLRLFLGESFEESSISAERIAVGAAFFAVLACGIGGIVSVALPFRRSPTT